MAKPSIVMLVANAMHNTLATTKLANNGNQQIPLQHQMDQSTDPKKEMAAAAGARCRPSPTTATGMLVPMADGSASNFPLEPLSNCNGP